MSVIQGLNNLASVVRAGRTDQVPQGLKPYLPVDDQSSVDFRRARTRLVSLYAQLEELAHLANISTRFKLDLPDARSTASLGLDLSRTAAALNSTEEINASPTSFSTFVPTWEDLSTAEILIGGEYDGSNGSGAYDFEVRRAGTHGDDNLRIRITDPQGNRFNRNIQAGDDPNQQYSLQNGLYFTLGPGELINRDNAALDVFDNIGSVVNPDNPLGGSGLVNPNLQFGTPSIIDGTFQLNGENISVSTSDTINDVVNRINQSTAGVTAGFNAGTEQIDFLQDTPGSAPAIDLQNDTSNLLQALKLSSAVVTPGIDPQDEQVLDDVAAFAAVQSGDIVISGNLISVDTSSDSLATVLDRINNSGANVVATFDQSSQRVVIEAQDAESELTIDSNGTGLFAALNLTEGRVDPEALSSGVSRSRSYAIADAATAAFAQLSSLFRDSTFIGRGTNSGQFRTPFESALRASFGDQTSSDMFGLVYNSSTDARRRGDYATVDRQTLTRNLQLRGDSVKDVLINAEGTGGLVFDLLRATRQALVGVNQALGLSGTFVDTFA